MSEKSTGPGPLPADATTDRTLRDVWKATQEHVRVRLDQPIERATSITQRTLAWFPIRVWRHFLQHNGFLLAAGMSYQSLFAIFGVIYLSFAAVGIWLGGSDTAVHALIALINNYIPGIISEHGLVAPDLVEQVARDSARLLTVTGVLAAVVVVWTAIGFVTYTRRAVRDTFGLPFDRRNYLLLKARDLFASIVFGLALLTGAVLGAITTGAVDLLFTLFGWGSDTFWFRFLGRTVSVLVAFALDAVALAGLFRFLSGTSLRWRRIWPGAVFGAAAMVTLQIGAGFLFVYTPSNPLLATFAIFVGFLLWFRLNGIVILVAAAWIAVAAADNDESLQTEDDLESMERAAVLLAAEVHLRDAKERLRTAPWYARWWRRRAVSVAHRDLTAARAAMPEPLRENALAD